MDQQNQSINQRYRNQSNAIWFNVVQKTIAGSMRAPCKNLLYVDGIKVHI